MALSRGGPGRKDDMSRSIEQMSEPAEEQRYFGDECGDDDYGGGGGGGGGSDSYSGNNNGRYECRGDFIARGAGAFRGNFRPPRMLFRGRVARPFGPRGGYGRGPPFRGRGPRFGRPPFGPPARGGWALSPRFNRGGPAPPRRPFFRGGTPQPARPPRFPRVRGGCSDRARGFRGGVRGGLGDNGGVSHDRTWHGHRRDVVGGGPDYSPESPQRPQCRTRSRSVGPPPREVGWRAQRSQGTTNNYYREGGREFHSSSSSEARGIEGRGRTHCSRDSVRGTTSRIRSRSVVEEMTQRIAARVASEARLREGTRDTTAETRSASRASTEAQAERMREGDRWMKRQDALPASSVHHAQTKTQTVSIRPSIRKVKASAQPAVDYTEVIALGATDKGQQSAAARRTECIRDASKRRVSMTTLPALDKRAPKEKKKAVKDIDLQIADRSCLSRSSEDASGDAEVRRDPHPATSTSGPDRVDDGQEFRRSTPEVSSSWTLLASPDSTTDRWTEQAVGEDMASQIMSTADLTETADVALTVRELRERSESSEEVECPELGVYEEVIDAQGDDVASEDLQEISDTAAFAESAGSLNCESGPDTESESTCTDDESEDAELVGSDQTEDAAAVISASPPASAENTDQRSTGTSGAYSTASMPLIVSAVGAADSLWSQSCDQTSNGQDSGCNAPEESAQGNGPTEQAFVSSQRTEPVVRDACTDACSATYYVDREQDTVSYLSTLTDACSTPKCVDWELDTASCTSTLSGSGADYVVPVSESFPAAAVARQGLEAPGPSTTPTGPWRSAAQQHQTPPREPGPLDAAATCDASASATKGALFELNAFAALAVHDFLGNEVAKRQTLAWYTTARRTNTKRACTHEMLKLLWTAANSTRAKRDNLSKALRRLARFQLTLQPSSRCTIPTAQERGDLADDTDP
ncbi:streptococcal hemagglutinin-like [Dermacentor albipictus]|uniref:streptococcal hemagglutinin-like n=1 Tax=Dermacentor albipictus TaxID=60249 RepID=UPI0038FC7271